MLSKQPAPASARVFKRKPRDGKQSDGAGLEKRPAWRDNKSATLNVQGMFQHGSYYNGRTVKGKLSISLLSRRLLGTACLKTGAVTPDLSESVVLKL